MDGTINRREFLDRAAVGTAAMTLAGRIATAQEQPSERVVVGVMGLSRGMALTQGFSAQPNVEVRYVCDTDCTRAEQAVAAMEKAGRPKPQIIPDFRKMLEDAELVALICAAPNHLHMPATILACNLGIFVYVERLCLPILFNRYVMVDFLLSNT